jgi:hypothetical protein
VCSIPISSYIIRYEWPLLEKLEEAILVQQVIVIEAQSAYDCVFSLGLHAKGGGKSMWFVRYIYKGADLVKWGPTEWLKQICRQLMSRKGIFAKKLQRLLYMRKLLTLLQRHSCRSNWSTM